MRLLGSSERFDSKQMEIKNIHQVPSGISKHAKDLGGTLRDLAGESALIPDFMVRNQRLGFVHGCHCFSLGLHPAQGIS